MQIQGLITPNSLTFLDDYGVPYNILSSHSNYEKIKSLFKDALNTANPLIVMQNLQKMVELSDVSHVINRNGDGKVTVSDGIVYFDNEEVDNVITDRIVSGLDEGFNMKPYISFLENLMQNPSKVAINELYPFMEHGKMGITDDGYLLAYKKVRYNFTDCYTGKFDNSPGQSHEMDRNKVDDDRNRTCSDGFHFCSFEYLSHFGSGNGDRVVLVKVNPRDVVSIPADYNNTKARCCAYEVLKELEDYASNPLANRSVWTNTHLNDVKIDEYEEDDSVSYDDDENDWSYQEHNENYDAMLEDNLEVLTDSDLELLEYFLDQNDKTVKIRAHVFRDEEVYVTEDADTIVKVFDFVKSKAALTGIKQAVKIVRI